MAADAAVTITADVGGGSLVGGLGIDLAAVSGGQLGLAGGCKGGWWQCGIVY
jgi:hypothetical protein